MINKVTRAGDVAQLLEYFSSTYEALGSISSNCINWAWWSTCIKRSALTTYKIQGGCLPARIAIRQAEIIPIDLIRIIPAEECRIEYTLCVPAASGEAPHCGRSTTCERTDIIPQKHANASYYQQPTDHMPRRYGTGYSLGSRADPSGAHGHSRKRRSRTPCLVGRLPSVRRR